MYNTNNLNLGTSSTLCLALPNSVSRGWDVPIGRIVSDATETLQYVSGCAYASTQRLASSAFSLTRSVVNATWQGVQTCASACLQATGMLVQGGVYTVKATQKVASTLLEAVDLSITVPSRLAFQGLLASIWTTRKLIVLPPGLLVFGVAKVYCPTVRLSRREIYNLQLLVPLPSRVKALGLFVPSTINTIASRSLYTHAFLRSKLKPDCRFTRQAYYELERELASTQSVTRGLWNEIFSAAPGRHQSSYSRRGVNLGIGRVAAFLWACTRPLSLWNKVRITHLTALYYLMSWETKMAFSVGICALMLIKHTPLDSISKVVETHRKYRWQLQNKILQVQSSITKASLVACLLVSDNIAIALLTGTYVQAKMIQRRCAYSDAYHHALQLPGSKHITRIFPDAYDL